MHITVTGATGHIGNNLVRQLLEKDYKVRVMYKSIEKSFVFDDLKVEKYVGDILDYNYVQEAIQGTDVVIHLAAIISIDGDPTGLVHKTNTLGVEHVVKACFKHHVSKLIHFSSIHAIKLSDANGIIDENLDSADASCMAYDQSKVKGEEIIIEAIQKGLNAYIILPTGVIGIHDYFYSLSGIMLNKLFSGKLPALIKGGFNWLDVQDLCTTTIQIIKLESNSCRSYLERRFIISGHWASLEELARLCSQISGKKAPSIIISKSVAKLGLPFIKIWTLITGSSQLYTLESINTLLDNPIVFSHDKATKELNYYPRPLKETLKKIFQWQKEHAINILI
ncbi:MAG: NAD-dependent epimerase/dehydratase family protein [Saprospiraceae bacterium]